METAFNRKEFILDHFELVSEYKPTGDQSQAIEALVKGFKEGKQCQTLLGVNGSGKTFTMANVIQQLIFRTMRWSISCSSVLGSENGDIWCFSVLFRPDFADSVRRNGLDDIRRTK